MTKFLLITITIYQKFFSPDSGFLTRTGILKERRVCAFYPTCSEYAKLALKKYGLTKGVFKSIGRIFRCHPWQTNHIDFP